MKWRSVLLRQTRVNYSLERVKVYLLNKVHSLLPVKWKYGGEKAEGRDHMDCKVFFLLFMRTWRHRVTLPLLFSITEQYMAHGSSEVSSPSQQWGRMSVTWWALCATLTRLCAKVTGWQGTSLWLFTAPRQWYRVRQETSVLEKLK